MLDLSRPAWPPPVLAALLGAAAVPRPGDTDLLPLLPPSESSNCTRTEPCVGCADRGRPWLYISAAAVTPSVPPVSIADRERAGRRLPIWATPLCPALSPPPPSPVRWAVKLGAGPSAFQSRLLSSSRDRWVVSASPKMERTPLNKGKATKSTKPAGGWWVRRVRIPPYLAAVVGVRGGQAIAS